MAYAGYKRHDHAILPFGFGLSDQLLGVFWAGTPVRRRPIEQARGQLADRCMKRGHPEACVSPYVDRPKCFWVIASHFNNFIG